jgi:D-3-phosphoglycerate dehydrogenase
MNTPGGNAISVAEHTLALMLAMARRIPEATQSTTGGKWEKKKFMGSELRGKSLGIVGLGSIGREVVKRARAFEMRVQAYDPYVTPQIAKDLGVELVDLAGLYAQSDYLTLHVALTPETERMLSYDAFAQMKTGVRIVNCARGELIDDEALRQAIEAGKVGSAALDVFAVEPPPPGYLLFAGNKVLATPHIGGSTEEAQQNIGHFVSAKLADYVRTGNSLLSVNLPQCHLDYAAGSHRLMHIHHNVPGILRAINDILADRGINIERQVLDTRGNLGYAIYDINRACDEDLMTQLRSVPQTIAVRTAGEA